MICTLILALIQAKYKHNFEVLYFITVIADIYIMAVGFIVTMSVLEKLELIS